MTDWSAEEIVRLGREHPLEPEEARRLGRRVLRLLRPEASEQELDGLVEEFMAARAARLEEGTR